MDKAVVENMEISLETINPRVLSSFLWTNGMNYPKGFRLEKRYVYDYELEFFTQSEGAMYIDGKLYPITKGDLVLRRPGQITQAVMPYCCYVICLDLASSTSKDPRTYYHCQVGQEFQPSYQNPILDNIPSVFHPYSEEQYLELFDLVMKEFINPSAVAPVLLKAYVMQILSMLALDACDPLNNDSILSSSHNIIFKKTIAYIKENIGSPLSLSKLAGVANLSPTYFHAVFTRTMGMTPNEYITKLRLEKAKELLIRTNLPIYNISIECGMDNTPYFSFLFKKRQGVSPAEFRKRHRYV